MHEGKQIGQEVDMGLHLLVFFLLDVNTNMNTDIIHILNLLVIFNNIVYSRIWILSR